MTTQHGACVATPAAELERRIMDPNVPKNEQEHWAAGEIARLRAELADYQRTVEKSYGLPTADGYKHCEECAVGCPDGNGCRNSGCPCHAALLTWQSPDAKDICFCGDYRIEHADNGRGPSLLNQPAPPPCDAFRLAVSEKS